ncbi:MAG: hypothetical protein QOD13_2795 [Thermoleophilaceae bacterium]|nr:hypothetical protein [Thermoleophilaceae bacterium]
MAAKQASMATSSTPASAHPMHRRPSMLSPVVVVAVSGALAAGAVVLATGSPVAWWWLAICAAASLPVVVWFGAHGRLFEPLPLLALVSAIFFVGRPLQLFVDWRDLYSYFRPRTEVGDLVLLEGQEVALFVSQRLGEPLATALGRASGACALFLVLLLAGYRLGVTLGLGRRLGTLRPGRPINQAAAIGLALAIGFAAQAAIVIRAGGPVQSIETANAQAALSDSFVLFFLAGFAPAALAVWVAWRKPADRREWVALGLCVAAVCGFFVVAGSRARVLILLLALAVIVNYLRRRWRVRELVVGAALFLAFVSSFVVFRNLAGDGSLRKATEESARHVLDQRVILNDTTSYDQVLFATTLYGRNLRHERGRFLLDGVRSYVPRRIDAGKPEGGDILFRRAVWGERFAAGRPPTAVGDLYIDFGFPGVAIGALLIGVFCHALLGLLRGTGPGREYRIALYALLLTVLYELVADTFSIALGFTLTLVVPFLIAVHLFGRLPRLAGARTAA